MSDKQAQSWCDCTAGRVPCKHRKRRGKFISLRTKQRHLLKTIQAPLHPKPACAVSSDPSTSLDDDFPVGIGADVDENPSVSATAEVVHLDNGSVTVATSRSSSPQSLPCKRRATVELPHPARQRPRVSHTFPSNRIETSTVESHIGALIEIDHTAEEAAAEELEEADEELNDLLQPIEVPDRFIDAFPSLAVSRQLKSKASRRIQADAPAFDGHAYSLGRWLNDLLLLGIESGWTEGSQERLYRVIKEHLPAESNFPSFQQAIDMVRRSSTQQARVYLACPNDCIIFKEKVFSEYSVDELARLKCPKCETMIAAPNSNRKAKKYLYIGLADRLKVLVEDRSTSELMRLPKINIQPSARVAVHDLWQSTAWWNHVVQGYGRIRRDSAGAVISDPSEFGQENDRRNIVLSLNIDGANPFDQKTQHSYTVFQCQILNLPEQLRDKPPYQLLVSIIPGPAKTNNVQPYLGVLVDELLELWHRGFEAFDPIAQKTIKVKVKLLFTACDLVAHYANNCQQGHSAVNGCMKCYTKGSKKGREAMRFGGYSELLKKQRPVNRNHDDVVRDARKYVSKLAQGVPASEAATDCRGVCGESELLRLPYFDVIEHTLLDMMHLTQGVVGRHFAKMITGSRLTNLVRNEKNRLANASTDADDAAMAAIEMELKKYRAACAAYDIKRHKAMGIRNDRRRIAALDKLGLRPTQPVPAHTISEKVRQSLDPSNLNHLAELSKKWHLSDTQQRRLDDECYSKILAPPNVAPPNKRPLASDSTMNCADWVAFSKIWGKYLLGQAFEDAEILQVYCNLIDFVGSLLHSKITKSLVADIFASQERLAQSVLNYFPPTEQSFVLHALVFHMPRTLSYWGPARGYWCFPYERFIGILARSIKSRKHPEANLVNRYLVQCQLRSPNPLSVFIPMSNSKADNHCPEYVDYLVNDENVRQVQWPCNRQNQPAGRALATVTKPRGRVFLPRLGQEFFEAMTFPSNSDIDRLGSTYSLLATDAKIWCGRWRFASSLRERRVHKHHTTQESWFCIRAKHVPSYWCTRLRFHKQGVLTKEELEEDGEVFLYGQFHEFQRLQVDGWERFGSPFIFGKCTMYKQWGLEHPITKLYYINPRSPLVPSPTFVQLKHIVSPISLGPDLHTQSVDSSTTNCNFVVLPMNT